MPKYLVQANYAPEGAKGILRDGGSARLAAVEAVVKKLGGRVEAFYFAFGYVDAFVILDLPDAATATALALAVNQTGVVKITTTVLATPQEVDQAVKKTVEYRPPGR